MIGNRFFAWALVILFIVGGIWTGCGYQLSGSGRMPKGVQHVFVAEPINRTSESQLISIISNSIKSELVSQRVRLVDEPNDADAILAGEIVSISDSTIARRGETMALEKRLIIRMDLKLEQQNGRALWVGKNISANKPYTVINGDDIATENNRQIAINELTKRLAEDIYNRLTADF